MMNMKNQSSKTQNYDEALEKRMDIIGQNGNDGLHYDVISGTEAAYARTVYPGEATITVDKELGTPTPPCVAHSHWSHGFSISDVVVVNGEQFRVIGFSESNLSLEFIEE